MVGMHVRRPLAGKMPAIIHASRRLALILFARTAVTISLIFYFCYAAPASSRPRDDLKQGKLLIATRRLGDPRFSQSVVLLVQYNQRGAMGLMLNFPTSITLQKAFPDIRALAKRSDSVFIGGPVDSKKMHFLFRKVPQKVQALQVIGGVYVSAGNQSLQDVVESAPRDPVRVYLGYAGWSPGQLEMEVDTGHWNLLPANVDIIFHKDPAHIWQELIDQSETIAI